MPPFTDDTGVVITAPHHVAPRAQELVGRHPTRASVALTVSVPASPRFNAHSSRPRPPQTPAASFKRLYRE